MYQIIFRMNSETNSFFHHLLMSLIEPNASCDGFLDNDLFILNLSGSCESVMTHLSPTGNDLHIRVSYHTKTVYGDH